MTDIGDFETKVELGASLDRVEKGEELVTKSVAINSQAADAAMERIRVRARSLTWNFDWEALKADRHGLKSYDAA